MTTKEQQLTDEIELIFEKYEDDFNLELISRDFYNVIIREREEARKELIEEFEKFCNKREDELFKIPCDKDACSSCSMLHENYVLKCFIEELMEKKQ